MKDITINRLMRLVSTLNSELKLELISRISESLKIDLTKKEETKEALLEELYGSWTDMEDGIAEEVLKSRSVSDRNISFD